MAMTKIENTKLLRNEAKEIESAVAVDVSAGLVWIIQKNQMVKYYL